MNDNTKSMLAELIGTFTLVFIGAGAGAIAENNSAGLLCVALAHGLALVVIVYAWGPISGAHVNPAVTLGIALTGKMEWGKVIQYWIAQFAGAVAAAFLLKFLFTGTGIASLGETKGQFTAVDPGKVIIVEAVLTFFLVTAVFGSAISGRNGNAFGIAIGFVLTMDILCGGPLTGASMNPVRTVGPALAAGNLGYVWMYLVGPFVGGGLAAIVYNSLFLSDKK